jgi:peptide/nickel transport system ATP-binding protein
MSETPLVRVVGLTRHFDVSPPLLNRILERKPKVFLKAVDGVDFDIRHGETFALVGESGCGKTTVARMLVGLEHPTQGIIEFDGHNISRLRTRARLRPYRRRMQMIFQDPFASLNPRWRVMDIVAEPIRAYGLIKGRKRVKNEVFRLLRQVGLSEDDSHNYPHEFSGGQRQRVAIARALSTRPQFVVCDEPTSALDVSVQAQILNVMKRLQQEMGLSYLLITHDLAVVHHIATRVGVMYLGRLCEMAASQSVFNRPRHPYTKLLLETLPDISMKRRDRAPMAGEVPNPMNPPPGCVFHPRCPLAADICTKEIPRRLMVDDTMVACHAVAGGWDSGK